MIVQITARLRGETGVLIIDDQTSRLLIRTDDLPADVVLKAYLYAARKDRSSGTLKSRKNGGTYGWRVLSPANPEQRRARRGWRAAVFV